MDTVILDVVIGLILTYLVLGMLVSKVQEYFVGQLGTSRQHTLHDMLEQTLQGDKGLKEKLLRNPLIFSLFQGNSVEQGAVRAKGPSAIPSDLFARALLIEVYDDGKGSHPKDKYASPRVFVDNLTSDKKQAHTIVGVLRGLLGGNEKDWPGYESAIAQWFDQVGARADGWFQRKASLWSLRLALLLAVVLNVNTFQLAERLSGDPDLRRTAVTLAKRTLDEFGDAKTKEATAPLAAPLAPNKRAEDALQLAHQLLSPIYFKNQKLASFDPNRQALKLDPQLTPIQACARAPAAIGKGTNGSQSALSNPKTWLELLPALRDEAGQLTLPEYVDLSAVAPPSETASEARKAAPPPVRCNAPKSGASAASALLQSSGPDNCTAETGPKSDNRADKKTDNKPLQDQTVSYERRRRDLHACITTLSSWVTTSFGAASADASLSAELKDVERALLDAKNAVREMIGDGGASLLVTRLYLRDPEAFVACTELPGMSRDRLRACVEAGSSGKLSLPVGWTARNIREAFCTIKKGEFDKPAPQVETACPFQPDEANSYGGTRALGIKPMVLQGTPLVSWTTFLYFLGFCVTAVFVALGAPFWFDLLGRVMKMRAAGEKPSTEASKDPAAKPAGGKDAAKTDGDGPVTPKGGGPFADSRNDFEALLTDADRVELQTLLGVKPTGRLDEETRRAIVVRAKALGVDLNGKDELSLLAYMAIVGRHPAALLNLGGGSLFAAKVGVLAPQLSQLLGFPLSEALQPAHRRALAMRYLFKQALDNRSDSPSLQDLDAMARSRAINRLDDWAEPARRPLEALTEDDLVKILKAGPPPRFNRSTTPWLDWAFGELGQFEENKSAPEASNPRVVEYLRAAGVMTGGDATPWCGAFAAWVVQRYNDEYPKAKLPDPPKDPETAENWKTWGVGLTQTETPQAGDIAIFNQDGDPLKFHVTWVVRVEADGRLRVIGGNQGDGCVSLAIRGGANDKVVKVCRGSTGAGGQAPVPPPPPPAPAPAPAPAP